jgi:hypothetical protein
MAQVFFRKKEQYLIGDGTVNMFFQIEDVPVKVTETEHAIYNICRDDHEGKQKGFLCLTVFTTEPDPNNLFDDSQKPEFTDTAKIDNLVDAKNSFLDELSERLAKQFRWLTNQPIQIYKKGRPFPLEWSSDSVSWQPLSNGEDDMNIVIKGYGGDDVIKVINKDLVNSLIAPNIEREEPLAWDLLDEAERLLDKDELRGSFLLGFTALEVGVKQYVLHKIPEATWMLINSPSPDIFRICKKFLPDLDKKLNMEEAKKVLPTIESYMQSRNRLVHRGDFNQDFGSVRKQLWVVEYVLHRLDYASGLDYAGKFSERTLQRVATGQGDDLIKKAKSK